MYYLFDMYQPNHVSETKFAFFNTEGGLSVFDVTTKDISQVVSNSSFVSKFNQYVVVLLSHLRADKKKRKSYMTVSPLQIVAAMTKDC